MRKLLTTLSALALTLSLSACHQALTATTSLPPIVGTWLVKMPEAPFKYHMFTFHSDGTLLQSNPDAGDANTSDSNGMGVWTPEGDTIKGKFVEVTADRTTRQFVSRGEISFNVKATSSTFSGTASAIFYDLHGKVLHGPLAATLQGQRITP